MLQDGIKFTEGLKKGRELPPVNCFYGDSYLIEEAVQDIKNRVLTSAFKDMNYNSFDAKEADADTIISAANTFPVMSKKRLIIVNRAESLLKSQQETFLGYFKNPVSTTCLTFIVSSDKIDKRLAFFSELDKAGYLFYFKPPSGRELPLWIKKEVQGAGKRITDEAVAAFMEIADNELRDIKQEIDKLALFVGKREMIEKKDVEMAVAKGRIDTVFDLADSLGKKDLRKGIMNLKRLMDQGEQPVKILGTISRQFRIMWRVKILKEKGTAVNGIAQQLGIFPSYVDGYLRQGNSFSTEELLSVFNILRGADIALKSGRQSAGMVLERLVLELCLK
ncbi:MAG: DNA polymerase III subunit delta [Deltaproteobacteria bacterium RIFCSPLOWO2_02_44_9]|nr:MAG: DNA polymerase III subunit delta [Deltaproteobacteria bacterium RIFCSPLOWO2_02_44_9]